MRKLLILYERGISYLLNTIFHIGLVTAAEKFAQIILEHNRSDISLLREAQRYIAYAISYYESLNATDHLYFLEAQKLQKNIDELLNCQGPV